MHRLTCLPCLCLWEIFIKTTSNDENNYITIYDNKEGVTETDLTASSFWRPLTTYH